MPRLILDCIGPDVKTTSAIDFCDILMVLEVLTCMTLVCFTQGMIASIEEYFSVTTEVCTLHTSNRIGCRMILLQSEMGIDVVKLNEGCLREGVIYQLLELQRLPYLAFFCELVTFSKRFSPARMHACAVE